MDLLGSCAGAGDGSSDDRMGPTAGGVLGEGAGTRACGSTRKTLLIRFTETQHANSSVSHNVLHNLGLFTSSLTCGMPLHAIQNLSNCTLSPSSSGRNLRFISVPKHSTKPGWMAA